MTKTLVGAADPDDEGPGMVVWLRDKLLAVPSPPQQGWTWVTVGGSGWRRTVRPDGSTWYEAGPLGRGWKSWKQEMRAVG